MALQGTQKSQGLDEKQFGRKGNGGTAVHRLHFK
jgi:hypothetical protein